MNASRIFFVVTLIISASFSWLYLSGQNTADSQNTITPIQKKEIEQIIHDYLIENPEVLLKASEKLQRKSMEEQMKSQQAAIERNKDKILASGSPEAGNPEGSVMLVEFLDYQCGHCKSMHTVVQSLIEDNPELRVSYQLIPILGEGSLTGTRAAFAARKQDKFKAFHEALLLEQERLSEKRVLEIANETGLDVDRLKKDMGSDEINSMIQKTYNLARSLGIQATPFFVVIGVPENGGGDEAFILPGAAPKERLQGFIDQAK